MAPPQQFQYSSSSQLQHSIRASSEQENDFEDNLMHYEVLKGYELPEDIFDHFRSERALKTPAEFGGNQYEGIGPPEAFPVGGGAHSVAQRLISFNNGQTPAVDSLILDSDNLELESDYGDESGYQSCENDRDYGRHHCDTLKEGFDISGTLSVEGDETGDSPAEEGSDAQMMSPEIFDTLIQMSEVDALIRETQEHLLGLQCMMDEKPVASCETEKNTSFPQSLSMSENSAVQEKSWLTTTQTAPETDSDTGDREASEMQNTSSLLSIPCRTSPAKGKSDNAARTVQEADVFHHIDATTNAKSDYLYSPIVNTLTKRKRSSGRRKSPITNEASSSVLTINKSHPWEWNQIAIGAVYTAVVLWCCFQSTSMFGNVSFLQSSAAQVWRTSQWWSGDGPSTLRATNLDNLETSESIPYEKPLYYRGSGGNLGRSAVWIASPKHGAMSEGSKIAVRYKTEISGGAEESKDDLRICFHLNRYNTETKLYSDDFLNDCLTANDTNFLIQVSTSGVYTISLTLLREERTEEGAKSTKQLGRDAVSFYHQFSAN